MLFVKELQSSGTSGAEITQTALSVRYVSPSLGCPSYFFPVDDLLSAQRRNVKILKIRFGQTALQVCEAMLKDMTDSKRIDGHVQSKKRYAFLKPSSPISNEIGIVQSIVHPTIISQHFWPTLESSDLVMPSQFNRLVHLSLFSGERARFLEFVPSNHRMQSEYAQEFALFKPDKKLKWLHHLGTAQLEIELGDRKLEVDVPPLEAVFIELFSQKRNFIFGCFGYN